MGLWDKLFSKGNKNQDGLKVHKNIDKNLQAIKDILTDASDVVYREIKVGDELDYKAVLIYVDGMADRILLNKFVLTNLMISTRITDERPISKEEVPKLIKERVIAVSETKEVDTIDDAVLNILSGETVLLLDGYEKIVIVASKGWPARGVSDPVTESVIRGPRDGFTETLRVNTVLIRRRIRDPRLKTKPYQLGVRSKTDVAVFYIEDIVEKNLLEEANKRLKQIEIDAILESGIVEQFIEDNWISLFPQTQYTERPDVVAAALYEGKVAIVVDNSPFVLLIPATFNSLMQSAEDYYERWAIATAIRFLRYLAVFISLTAPSLYVALTSFHPQMIPVKLALALAANRQGVPFPSIVEALLMEATIEILREAGVRLPKPIGATIGIVGGLVIGQAAVEAGLVAPLMVIVVAVTAISSFAIPSYNVSIAFRLLRFIFIFAAGFLGLYGISLVGLLLLIHLCSLKSFGTPYLSPFVVFIDNISDLKDSIIKAPAIALSNRPSTANRGQKNRMDDKRPEDFGKGEK
ncbi:spore germination protein [Alkaliphilus serpentinus]|uniref:Spore germination protein n=1 Tax=Alkaliphilus serpentinus TaxID=1482731 RepID=A0A833MB70_9FIRM|nr:spore germination protein [Alkaliphilus serpentinus]KAB3532482.1 spore germination protein [Alkaliphilus serpentinus]